MPAIATNRDIVHANYDEVSMSELEHRIDMHKNIPSVAHILNTQTLIVFGFSIPFIAPKSLFQKSFQF